MVSFLSDKIPTTNVDIIQHSRKEKETCSKKNQNTTTTLPQPVWLLWLFWSCFSCFFFFFLKHTCKFTRSRKAWAFQAEGIMESERREWAGWSFWRRIRHGYFNRRVLCWHWRWHTGIKWYTEVCSELISIPACSRDVQKPSAWFRFLVVFYIAIYPAALRAGDLNSPG